MFKGALAARQKGIEMLPKSETGSESSTGWSDNRTRVTTVITAEVPRSHDAGRSIGSGTITEARDVRDDQL